MWYSGKDRRVHTVFVTRNREYHTNRGVCVAVRDRRSTAWISNHEAIGMALQLNNDDEIVQGRPLQLLSPFASIYTSKVLDIFRPGRKTFQMYGLIQKLQPA